MDKILGIIPARYASTRFPGKPLTLIKGKTMIQRVYEQALQCKRLTELVVATDDERIMTAIAGFGGKVVMTSANHNSGTERCKEVIDIIGKEKFEIIINIQGDEPFINPEQIEQVIECFKDKNTGIATLAKIMDDEDEINNPSVVKLVRNNTGGALYFSRFPIPYLRETGGKPDSKAFDYLKHIGIYGYRVKTLEAITNLPPSKLETAESLEQLRWLENGFPIHVALTDYNSFAIDTVEDLKRISPPPPKGRK
jgi:3-deoxy-manno-octulosonate cytidylyltransferase (CMP-KDO synthetase)